MSEYTACLDRSIAAAEQEIRALAADDRRDEADLAKVKRNILEVCKTVWNAFCRAGKTREDYLARLDGFQESWYTALIQARAHGKTEAAVIEETKLAALAQVRAQFLALQEEQP